MNSYYFQNLPIRFLMLMLVHLDLKKRMHKPHVCTIFCLCTLAQIFLLRIGTMTSWQNNTQLFCLDL